MNFLRKIFTKKDERYGNALQFKNNDCTRCDEIPQNLKKCHNCCERKICNKCYYEEDKKLCGKCVASYDIWMQRVFETYNGKLKTEKYNFGYKNGDEKLNSFL